MFLLGLTLAAVMLTVFAAGATAIKEAPWRPDAAAYRTTLFYLNLKPVPWARVEEAWSRPYPGAATRTPAAEMLGAAAGPIRAAIAARDPQAVFVAMNRALVAQLTARVDKARAAIDGGEPAPHVAAAREIYRAFADGIAAADPSAARDLGIAWLDLASAGGSRGVLGAGTVRADRDRFDRAAGTIVAYLSGAFAPREPAARSRFLPLPEGFADADMPPFLPAGSFIGDQTPLPKLVLNFEEQGIDETDLPLIAYGDMLFDSPQVFGDPARALGIACSTCHNRSDINRDFFIPGTAHRAGAIDVDGEFFNPMFNDRRDDPVDIPSLRGLRFTGPYGRDGRFASLREFTRNVIVNEFAGAEPTPFMLDALVAYMTEFDFLPNAKLSGDGRLTDKAGAAARRGEMVFKRPFAGMDDRSCADCHIPSANFLDRKAHDIGSKPPGYAGDVSGAFDTPTLRGLQFTAPYFHDGALPTIASVVDWKADRYGLALTDAERADLIAYLDAVGDADEPYETFDERNTQFRLAFDELTTFASTLNTLLPKRDAFHALLLIDTVSGDLAADASVMGNLDAKPQIYALAERLAAVGQAIRDDDWALAQAEWAAFQSLQSEIDRQVY